MLVKNNKIKIPPEQLPLAISMGDPSGLSPHLIHNAWHKKLYPFFVVGDIQLFNNAQIIKTPEEALEVFPNAIPIIKTPHKTKGRSGISDKQDAKAIVESLELSANFVLNKKARALVTCPIQKFALEDAGFQGQTEFLAKILGAKDSAMMMANHQLKVVVATTHIPLSQVPTALTKQKLESKIQITLNFLQEKFGIKEPKIAIAGLNPHAGEEGLIGTEEMKIISPICQKFPQVTGPLPADSLFSYRSRIKYHAIICMYHDQGLIPFKTLGEGVNVTMGLPIIRTSPSHGVALDIARLPEKEIAKVIDYSGFDQAIKMACDLSK